MGFSTPAQQEQFLVDVPGFERMLADAGIRLVKYWLDISKDEQAQRLEERREDPLKQLKVSAAGRRRPEEVEGLFPGARRDADPHQFRARALDLRA